MKKHLLYIVICLVCVSCDNKSADIFGTYETQSGKTHINAIIIKEIVNEDSEYNIMLYLAFRSPLRNNTGNKYINNGIFSVSKQNSDVLGK